MSDYYDEPICDFPCSVCNPEYFDEDGDELSPAEIKRMLGDE
ncbi:hypothetical protein SEA_MOLIVIA_13 [Arthrobacter phage Molivia]|uniref:Uncharacterized protein n=1 Tax=Arthrobacter phage Molivia TaxID=2015839 RepID=A0A286N4D5_9CAUD|nr:hypothetical protein FDI28_gp13 [Arthrobacter phage Molivia]ASX99242.1 hypothetical protein SEA_MOLIVIA_13 [Arthrobacter phage Molivia]